MDKEFKLYKLSNERLDIILSLDKEHLYYYIDNIIKNYYPKIKQGSDIYEDLQLAYRSSFVLERIYRSNLLFQEGFSAVYTKTGFIRNLINDIYFDEKDLLIH